MEHCLFVVEPLEPSWGIASVKLHSLLRKITLNRGAKQLIPNYHRDPEPWGSGIPALSKFHRASSIWGRGYNLVRRFGSRPVGRIHGRQIDSQFGRLSEGIVRCADGLGIVLTE